MVRIENLANLYRNKKKYINHVFFKSRGQLNDNFNAE